MIIAAFNPKGGVGKTTTAVNLAAALARSGRSVLLVDLEADQNASISLGIGSRTAAPTIADVLVHDARAQDAVRPVSGIDNLHLIPGARALAHMDERLRNVRQPERRLADVIKPLEPQFDTIVLDAPAGYSLVNVSIPSAAQHLIVPIRAEYLSLESLAQFLRWYRDRRDSRGPIAHIAGILLTMVDYRRQATREIVDMIRVHNRQGVFRTEIPQDQRVPEAPSHGLPLCIYSPGCRAATGYQRLAAELTKRVQPRA
jgi:chromosome partitioning protein